MKIIVRFNLLLTVVVSFLAMSSAIPVFPVAISGNRVLDYGWDTFPDTDDCTLFYGGYVVDIVRIPCDKKCPINCIDEHYEFILVDVHHFSCPMGLLYNHSMRSCDFPGRVECPHTPKCAD